MFVDFVDNQLWVPQTQGNFKLKLDKVNFGSTLCEVEWEYYIYPIIHISETLPNEASSHLSEKFFCELVCTFNIPLIRQYLK